jgi:VanZ family protein
MTQALLPSLRYPRAWFLAGLLIATAITVTSLLPARDLPALGISDKIEHAVAYLLLAFWFASVMARRDYVYLVLALLAFGGGIEIAQGLMGLGREADLLDLAADGVGVLAGVALAVTPLGRWAKVIEDLVARRGA